jgi:hypothetical protein
MRIFLDVANMGTHPDIAFGQMDVSLNEPMSTNINKVPTIVIFNAKLESTLAMDSSFKFSEEGIKEFLDDVKKKWNDPEWIAEH